MNNSIIFEERSKCGIILLNKPQKLNALDLEMTELFYEKLISWEKDNNIKRILIKGDGRAFCAGGDVKSMFLSSGISDLKKKFLFKEYKLNYVISKFSKPYLSIWDGIVMGGGFGLSIYGNARIATENSKFAMPETAIGFFPDVGSSYFLSRMRNNIGLYLGLTGNVITAEEMINLGLATHYFNSNNIEKVEFDYISNGFLRYSDKFEKNNTQLLNNIAFIEETFEGNIFNIIRKLKKSNLEFAKITYEHLSRRCPMSLAVTCELINRAKKLTIKECLEMDFQLSQHIIYRDDFNNGVDAVLVSKTYKPKWNPSSINDINEHDIFKFFKFHTDTLKL